MPGYVIAAPPFTASSAGVRCLYRLCHELNVLGYPSYMTDLNQPVSSNQSVPGLVAPRIGRREAEILCSRDYTVVYPEVIAGNPLKAQAVARWVLNRPGLIAGDEVYHASELVFSYSDVYSPYIRNRIAGKLHMPTIDEDLFYCDDWDLTKRNLDCFYVGKSKWQDGIVDCDRAFRDYP